MRRSMPVLCAVLCMLMVPSVVQAKECPLEKTPFCFVLWPAQVVWSVAKAPFDMAGGFAQTIFTMFGSSDGQANPAPAAKPSASAKK